MQYFISKDKMVLDFIGMPAVRFKYLIANVNDSIMTLKDLQNNQFELKYESRLLTHQELNN